MSPAASRGRRRSRLPARSRGTRGRPSSRPSVTSSPREPPTRAWWTVPTKASTRSSNASSSRASARWAGSCTPAVPATSRCRSICGCLNREAAARAAGGLLLATDVADYLVARGVAFRRAHELVGGMVRQLLVEHRDFAALSLAEWRRFSDLFDEDVLAVVTPERSVAARRTPQSTSPVAVSRALGETRAWLESAGAASPSGAGR